MVCRLDYFRHFERPIEEKSQWNRLLISPLIYKSLLIGFERNVPIYEFTWYRVKSKKEFDFWRLFIDLLSVKLVYRNPATTEAVHLSNVYVCVQFVLFFCYYFGFNSIWEHDHAWKSKTETINHHTTQNLDVFFEMIAKHLSLEFFFLDSTKTIWFENIVSHRLLIAHLTY